ncbi:hypothetical protein [Risungbinella massiliensis]|uniref:hypothetical protein n=1 Tax=Risungbinella massiliensis TaxID=1329796 RepID=UPI0005CB9D9E|nr:hypothetical protein [Risungbinella massiliensis]
MNVVWKVLSWVLGAIGLGILRLILFLSPFVIYFYTDNIRLTLAYMMFIIFNRASFVQMYNEYHQETVEAYENHRSLAYFRKGPTRLYAFLGGALGELVFTILFRYKLDNYFHMVSIVGGLISNILLYSLILGFI